MRGLVSRATGLTSEGSVVLSVALQQAQQSALTEQLREALSPRSVIEQAIGIALGEQRCSAAAAFTALRAASQGRNRTLRDIAADIVTSVGDAPQQPTPFTDPR